MCSEDVARRLYEPLSTNMERLGAFLSAPVETVVCDDGSSLVEWFDVFRTCQGHEVWQTHGDWVRDVHPMFGPGVKDRFEMASQITDAEVAVARHRRRLISGRLDKLLADSVLMIDHCVPALSQIVLTCALLALTRHSHTKRKNSHSTTISARW